MFGRCLNRLFWSLYGPKVWESERATERLPLIQVVTDLLLIRQRMENERVLDAGCGTGAYSMSLAEAGFDVSGIDFAAGTIASARSITSRDTPGPVSFEVGDLNRPLAFPDAHFNHCINISVLQLLEDPVFTLKELWCVLKPGGTMVLLHVPRGQLGAQSYRDAVRSRITRLETKGLLRQLLVTPKVYAEKTRAVTYWTEEELYQIVTKAGFLPFSTESLSPIVILAEKRG